MIKIFFVLVLCLGNISMAWSQNNLDSLSGLAITYSPSALLNLFPGVQFGLEYSNGNRKFYEIEAAFMPKINGEQELWKRGIRIKAGYKSISRKNLLFLTTLYLRRSYHQHKNYINYDDEFEELREYRKTKTLIGPTAGIGYSKYFTKTVGMDLGFSVGPGLYFIRTNNLPPDAFENFFFDLYTRGGLYFYPIFAFSLKLKVRICGFDSSRSRTKKIR